MSKRWLPTAVVTLVALAMTGAVSAQGNMMGPAANHGGYESHRGWREGPDDWRGRHSVPYGGGTGMMGGHGAGMMGGYGMGMMGGYGMGMMGGAVGPLPSDAAPLPQSDIQGRLRAILPSFPEGAQIEDVMPFTNNVYAQVVDADGRGIAEVIVDRFTGSVTPEPGPNMMWNLRGWSGAPGGSMMGGVGGGTGPYGSDMMGSRGNSMMGATPADPGTARYDLGQAQAAANSFLTGYAPGASVVQSQTFPGYYTFDYGAASVQGMLSVNAFTGAVWPHTWHGAFLGTEP